eukprot:5896069-Amphidinium_carterae.1
MNMNIMLNGRTAQDIFENNKDETNEHQHPQVDCPHTLPGDAQHKHVEQDGCVRHILNITGMNIMSMMPKSCKSMWHDIQVAKGKLVYKKTEAKP